MTWRLAIQGWRAREPVSGYSHLTGLAFAFVGASVLLARAWHARASLATALVYVVGLVGLYAASSAYHLVPSGEALRRRLRKLDHAAIFLMIAGTCTPVFWRAFDGGTRTAMLCGIWSVAAAGIVFRLVWLSAPRLLYTVMYLGMGWMFLVEAPSGFRALPGTVLALVLAGGVTYTAGAVVYALKRPDPFPPVFGFHEIWHLLVLGGSALHYAAIAALVG
ncbi:MAG: PAQR family membrane homeostasis protein TrhA [Polyangiaceae bacterium]